MIISHIKQYDKRRSKVLFDEDFAIILYNTEIKKMHLSIGDGISIERYHDEIVPIITKRARDRIVYLLKDQDRTESDLRQRLNKGYVPDDIIDDVITWGKDRHYIDDMRYAENYIRYRSQGKSKRYIEYDLTQKGIARDIIMQTLEDVSIDDIDSIKKELDKKKYNPQTADYDTKKKLIAYLARKGYRYDSIKSVMGYIDE